MTQHQLQAEAQKALELAQNYYNRQIPDFFVHQLHHPSVQIALSFEYRSFPPNISFFRHRLPIESAKEALIQM